MDNLEQGLVQSGVVLHQRVVVHGREVPLLLDVGGQGVHILGLGTDHVGGGHARHKLPGRHGEEVLVLAAIRPVQVAKHLVNSGTQVVRRGVNGLLAAGLAQQVEEHADGVDQQLFVQRGHNGAVEHVVLLGGVIVQLFGGDGGAVPGEGTAQQEVRRHIIIVAGLRDKGQTGLTHAVLIVGEQRLADPQILCGRALGDPLLLPEQGKAAGKIGTHNTPQLQLASKQ